MTNYPKGRNDENCNTSDLQYLARPLKINLAPALSHTRSQRYCQVADVYFVLQQSIKIMKLSEHPSMPEVLAALGLKASSTSPLTFDRYVVRGGALLQNSHVYAVVAGTFKEELFTEDSCIVSRFGYKGSLLGLDTLYADSSLGGSLITALTPANVIAIPKSLILGYPVDFDWLLSVAVARIAEMGEKNFHCSTLLLRHLVPWFLVDLSTRHKALGCDPLRLQLQASREDIASYLGAKLESISRLLNGLQREGILTLCGPLGREVEINNMELLVELSRGNDLPGVQARA